jgi:hypothetical protein
VGGGGAGKEGGVMDEINRLHCYCGGFDCWDDVCRAFNISGKELPFVFAAYDFDQCGGDAMVVVSADAETFGMVEGSHCSCYGLEGQWDLTEHSMAEIAQMVADDADNYQREMKAAARRWLLMITEETS